jgi:Cd2+/Zn2+-exporting ATPase
MDTMNHSDRPLDQVSEQASDPAIKTFIITGMDCADCARSIERGVRTLEGVSACSLNFAAAKLHVSGPAAAERVIERVRQLGYDVAPPETPPSAPQSGVWGFVRFLTTRRQTTLALIGALLILPGLLFDELLPGVGEQLPWVTFFSLAALAVAGYPVARSAWRSLRLNREISINLLMTIAALGALWIGAYSEAGLVMVLFAVGEALEGYSMERTRASIRSLMQIVPDEAIVLRPCLNCKEHMGQDGYVGGPCPFCGMEEMRVPVEKVLAGETLIVRPGEKAPMDGRVLHGSSAVNQAPITGESLPIEVAPGDVIFAGSINGEGVLEIETTGRAQDNTISRMIRMVEEAQERRAPVQRLVDRFARVYTPAVILLAALVAVLPPLLWRAPFFNPSVAEQGWLYRALELLVVACPCALVISTPVTLVSAISNAARHGVLIKGGAHLEALSRVQTIAFDKTGTLTEGRPRVVKVRSVECANHGEGECECCDDLLALTSAVERRSEHPLARAIVNAADDRNLQRLYPAAENVMALSGRGVKGAVNGHAIFIGNHASFDEEIPHDAAHCAEMKAAAAQGYTLMLISANQRYLGYITIADSVRASSRSVLQQLTETGVQSLVMLTGDAQATAQRIGQELGLAEVRAELLPEHKVDAVQQMKDQLRERQGAVAMVGDGINDAPALAAATVGIAMGAGGSAQAMESADIALMNDDLSRLPFALRLSQAAMRTVRQNIVFAIGLKLIVFALVLAGWGAMWLAVLADVGASLLVTLNGMRMLSVKVG